MTLRTCLKCQNDFPSTWIGNRICEKCKSFANNPVHGKLASPSQNETGRRVNPHPIEA